MKKNKPVSASAIGEITFCPRKRYYRVHSKTSKPEKDFLAKRGKAHDQIVENRVYTESKDTRCYIASYLYGHEHPKTNLLRAWRDSYLLNSWWGIILVNLYYALSPLVVKLAAICPALDWTLRKFINDKILPRINDD